MSVTVPVFFYQKATIDNRYSQSSRTNILVKCLFNKKWNDEFLLFSEKSYCPENLMCWNAVEQFKRAPEKLRRKLIKVIMETYLIEGSPLELNIQRNLFNNFEDISAITDSIKRQENEMKRLVAENNIVVGTIKKRRSMKMISIQPNILDRVQKQCEVNMVDCFDRFYIQYWQDMCKDLESDEN